MEVKVICSHNAGRLRRSARVQRCPNWDRVLGCSVCECWISWSVHASIRHTELDNQAGERVAELIFPLSSALFFEIGERQCTVEKIFSFV